jgi:hypothetical protein
MQTMDQAVYSMLMDSLRAVCHVASAQGRLLSMEPGETPAIGAMIAELFHAQQRVEHAQHAFAAHGAAHLVTSDISEAMCRIGRQARPLRYNCNIPVPLEQQDIATSKEMQDDCSRFLKVVQIQGLPVVCVRYTDDDFPVKWTLAKSLVSATHLAGVYHKKYGGRKEIVKLELASPLVPWSNSCAARGGCWIESVSLTNSWFKIQYGVAGFGRNRTFFEQALATAAAFAAVATEAAVAAQPRYQLVREYFEVGGAHYKFCAHCIRLVKEAFIQYQQESCQDSNLRAIQPAAASQTAQPAAASQAVQSGHKARPDREARSPWTSWQPQQTNPHPRPDTSSNGSGGIEAPIQDHAEAIQAAGLPDDGTRNHMRNCTVDADGSNSDILVL